MNKSDISSIDSTIDRYLSGKMTESEKSEFETLIAESPELQDDIRLSSSIINTINNSGRDEDARLLAAMKDVDAKVFQSMLKQSSQPRKRINTKFISITLSSAVTIAAIICSVIYVYSYKSMNDIYSQYYTKPTDYTLITIRGDKEASHDALEYNKAMLSFTSNDETIDYLTKIVMQGDRNIYYQDACWQLALCYILDHDKENATAILNKIIIENQVNKDKAKEILNVL